MNMNDVVAVVVTYNRKALLVECIRHLQELEKSKCDILIIDNGSNDGTKEEIQSLIDNNTILYKNTGENLGGAGGFAFGSELAVQLGYKYAWLMDDDTFVERDSLDKLVDASEKLNGNFGWLSSVALWKDNSICNMNLQRSGMHKKVDINSGKLIPAIMATFVSFFVSCEKIKKYGLPIKEFFIWSDDLEYSRRISRENPCYVVAESKVIHYMGSNSKVGIENDSIDRIWRYEYMYRNEVYLYRREGVKGWIYVLLRTLLHTYKVMRYADGNKMKKVGIIWRSVLSGVRFKPPVRYVQH